MVFLLLFFTFSTSWATNFGRANLNRAVLDQIDLANRLGRPCPPQVVNGKIAVGPRGEELFQPVVKILVEETSMKYNCSATFVGPGVLLTAAHCVDSRLKVPRNRHGYYESGPGRISINGRSVAYTKIHAMKNDFPDSQKFEDVVKGGDLAVIQLSETQTPGNHYEISLRPPSAGSIAELVGYSTIPGFMVVRSNGQIKTYENLPSDQGKKWGRNKIEGGEGELVYTTATIFALAPDKIAPHPSEDAGIARGDSGGPLIHNRRVVGVNSSIEISDKTFDPTSSQYLQKRDYFMSLGAPKASAFLRHLKARGVKLQFEK